jgi:beta-glucosidase
MMRSVLFKKIGNGLINKERIVKMNRGMTIMLAACCAGGVTAAKPPVYKDSGRSVEKRVEDLLGRMTLEEKVAQMDCQFLKSAKAGEKDGRGRLRDYDVGFVYNMGSSSKAAEVARINNEEQRNTIENTRLGIPVLNHEEAHHGICRTPSTLFPTAIAMAAMWDVELYEAAVDVVAEEALAMNIRHFLSPPVANLSRDPRWGRTEETYGEDVYMASRMSVAATRAFRKLGLVNTAKHFVANYGDGGRDSWPVYYSERQLREYWMRPFERAVKEGGLRGIMPAYNLLNGKSCHADHWLLTEVLRDEWGFKGIVTSDYGEHSKGMVYRHNLTATLEEGAAVLINAGLDSCHPNGMESLLPAVTNGLISEERINESVRRILRVKMEAGLFDNPYVDEDAANKIVRSAEHQQIALDAARRAIVLLKNEGNVLPLAKASAVGLAGPAASEFFAGGYARYVMGSDISPAEGIKGLVGAQKVRVHQLGEPLEPFAEGCDAILYFATIVEGEGRDRASLDLPVFNDKNPPRAHEDDLTILVQQNERMLHGGDQEQEILDLAASGKPVIVVLVSGSPVTMNRWEEKVTGIVQMWYGGEKGGQAIAEVLFGDYNPGGKLPITFPMTIGQVPIYYDHATYGRGLHYWDLSGKPRYSFGFGLSYTTFELSDFSVPREASMDKVFPVKVTVKNTGERAGTEVVQLYVRKNVSSWARPYKKLVAFKRVAVEPGELKEVTLMVEPEELSILDEEYNRIVEPGSYRLMVGTSSEPKAKGGYGDWDAALRKNVNMK